MATPRQSVREVTVDADHDGQRLDNFLMREIGSVPRSLVYRLIRTGQVRVDGGRAKPMRKLARGETVRIPPVQATGGPASVPDGVIERIRGAIVHRQSELLVVDKPSGIAAQAGSGLAWGLSDAVARIVPDAVPVHRLDRETSGLMVFAVGRTAAAELQKAFRERRVDKKYLALLDGRLREDRVEVDAPLSKVRDGSGQHRVVVDEAGDDARSTFQRLETIGHRDFVEVRIETGRTHQIRVHAAHLGAPVAGDERYNERPDSVPGLERLFLHAAALRLPWPEDQLFGAPLPHDLDEPLDALRGASA